MLSLRATTSVRLTTCTGCEQATPGRPRSADAAPEAAVICVISAFGTTRPCAPTDVIAHVN